MADADMQHMVGDGGGRLVQRHRLRVSAVNILVRTLIGMKLFHVINSPSSHEGGSLPQLEKMNTEIIAKTHR